MAFPPRRLLGWCITWDRDLWRRSWMINMIVFHVIYWVWRGYTVDCKSKQPNIISVKYALLKWLTFQQYLALFYVFCKVELNQNITFASLHLIHVWCVWRCRRVCYLILNTHIETGINPQNYISGSKTMLEIILPSKNLDNIPLLIETWYVVKIRKLNANIKHHLYVRWFADSSSLSHWHADRSSLAKVTLQISF